MFSSVFWNANIHLSEIFYLYISESQTYLKYYHFQKQIFQFCLHDIYLLALLFKRASLCNWQQLDRQILYKFKYHLSKKIF